jgi:MOSC domain-containing protein YiiM
VIIQIFFYGIEVSAKDIALNHFVGRRLKIGYVLLQGIELCEPCGYLSDLLNQPLKDALKHRGGLRCEILQSGVLIPHMEITPHDEDADILPNYI